MNEQELRAHEEAARRDTAGPLRALLDTLQATLHAVYTAGAGSTHHKLPEHVQTTVRGQLDAILRQIETDADFTAIRNRLHTAARDALLSGAESTGLDVTVAPRLPREMRDALRQLTADSRRDFRAARALARGNLDRWGDLQAVTTAARKALNRIDRAATWMVHHGHDVGVQRAVEKAWSQGYQVARVWIAERDACTICLGYAGAVAEPGEPFEPRFVVGDHPPDGPVHGPGDMHPHCRCRTELWLGATADDELTDVDLPTALRREAQRSVLSGQAQGSEPGRLRAAERLAEVADLLVPKTVVKKAKKAVEAGRFPA